MCFGSAMTLAPLSTTNSAVSIGWIVPNCERPEPIVVLSPKATILILWANAQFGMTNTFNAPMETT